jgi:integrase
MRFRFGGKPQKLTIGSTVMGLAAARKEAARAVYEISQGRNPAASKREAKDKLRLDALRVADTLYSVTENFLALEGSKLRSVDERRRTFQRLIYPTLGARPISDIRRSEIVKLLDAIEVQSGGSMAHQTLAYLRRVMSWHAARSDDFRSPIVRGMRRIDAKARARSRILSDAEIQKVWKACDATEGAFGGFIKFLLLTGARRTEAAGLRFDEITGTDWTLPASRNKVKTDLTRPLSAAAMKVITETPKTSAEFVFSADGEGPLSGFARPKAKLDAQSGTTGWTLHDLRRTARSLLARAGVPSEHAERCLGHVLPGIQATYNQHKYSDEMRRAYEMLASETRRIVNPPPEGKVIKIKTARGADLSG